MFLAVGAGEQCPRKHPVSTFNVLVSPAQLHIHFPNVLPFALSSGPVLLTTLGIVEAPGRSSPPLGLSLFLGVEGGWEPPEISWYLALAWQFLSTGWPTVHSCVGNRV